MGRTPKNHIRQDHLQYVCIGGQGIKDRRPPKSISGRELRGHVQSGKPSQKAVQAAPSPSGVCVGDGERWWLKLMEKQKQGKEQS